MGHTRTSKTGKSPEQCATIALKKIGNRTSTNGGSYSFNAANATLKTQNDNHPRISLNLVYAGVMSSGRNAHYTRTNIEVCNISNDIITLLKKYGFYIPFEVKTDGEE